MTDADSEPAARPDPALLDRLQLIEEQPVETRADALAQLHDELRAMLEAGDAPTGA